MGKIGMHHLCAMVTKQCECDIVQRNNMYVPGLCHAMGVH